MKTQIEAITNFTYHLWSQGIESTSDLIADGKLHRAHVVGHRLGSLNLAYIMHFDCMPAAWYLDFKTGTTGTWTLSGKRERMTPGMRRQIAYAKEVRETEQAAKYAKAATKARWIWENSKQANTDHPYLATKKIKPHCARVYKDALTIPLIDDQGDLLSLEFVRPDRTKRFLTGGKKSGCFSTLGDPTPTVLICEGWATGASLYEATGYYVIVALDAGNMPGVAITIRAKYSEAKIIICGDNDENGVGQEAARKAALACGGKYILPPMIDTDWNDFIVAGGRIHV